MLRKRLLAVLVLGVPAAAVAQTAFTPGNLVVLQTTGSTSKEATAITLKEVTPSGTAGFSVTLPASGPSAIQTAGVFGGSEGFLTTSLDGKNLVVAGYNTGNYYSDITSTASSTVPRVVGTVAPSGFYLPVATSTTFFSANDIRGAVADSTNFWAAGASNASVDGIDYFGLGTPAALAGGTTPPKAYGLRIFNGELFYSTQKSGPSNSNSQLGIFTLSGLPTSGTVAPVQVINTGTVIPQDFSFNAAGTVCYIAVSQNNAAGGIQKWTKSGSTWSLAYTLGTGATNIGAYGLVVDYSGTAPVLYATTFESTGNRVVKITDNGTLATAGITTLVAATSGTFYKGITFAPTVASGTPVVNIALSRDTASETGSTQVIVRATTSFATSTSKTVTLGVTGTGVTSGDYTLAPGTTITIPAGATVGTDTLTVVDDALVEGTETATLSLSAPSAGLALGLVPSKTLVLLDNDAPAPPTISLNTAATTNFIDGGISMAPASPYKVSGVVNDPTDPAATLGLQFSVATNLATGTLTLTGTSSNPLVVPASGIAISGTGATRTVRITPVGTGYATITLKLKDGFDSSTYVVAYAASAGAATPAATTWHTGMADGSDAVALDSAWFVCGDDELNVLNVYARAQSGLPVASYNYTSSLALPNPGSPEADIEAAARSPRTAGRVYWAGSMSNGKAPFDNKPNRDRIFATTITGTGAATTFTFAGWAALKSAVLAWGDAQGYGFSTSAAAGVDSKAANGFALEGMTFGPDSTTLYLGFRAPLVPTATRKNAVIAPIQNFETWFNNGTPSGTPVIGAAIELDLGGRGIRDMALLPNGTYIIVAGDAGGAQKGALYKWSGKRTDTPIRLATPAVDTLNLEGVMAVSGPGGVTGLQLISDGGDNVLYNDGIVGKDFGDLQLRKFRSDVVSANLSLSTPAPPPAAVAAVSGDAAWSVSPNAATGPVVLRFAAALAEPLAVSVIDLNGRVLLEQTFRTSVGTNEIDLDLSALPKGLHLLRLRSATVSGSTKLLLQ